MARFEGDGTGYTREPASHQELRLERAIVDPDRPEPVAIEHVRPDVDAGRFSVKRAVGDTVTVTADVFTHGHTEIAAQLEFRHQAGRTWKRAPMRFAGNDHWIGTFPVDSARRVPVPDRRLARRSRDLVSRLHQEARRERRCRARCRGGRAARGGARQVRELARPSHAHRLGRPAPRRRRPAHDRAPRSIRHGGATRDRTTRVHGLRRHFARMGRSPARTVLGVVRAVPAVGIVGSDSDPAHSPTSSTGCRTSRRWGSTSSTCRRSIRSGRVIARAATTRQRRAPRIRAARGRSVASRVATPPCIRSSAPSPMSKRSSRRRGPTTSRSRSTWRSRLRPTIRGCASTRLGSVTVPTGRSRTPRTRRSGTKTSTRSTSTRPTAKASGRRCSTSSDSGSSAGSACSASTIRTRNRSRSGSG